MLGVCLMDSQIIMVVAWCADRGSVWAQRNCFSLKNKW